MPRFLSARTMSLAALVSACTADEPVVDKEITDTDEVAVAEEFCLDGEINLGARLQGRAPGRDEFYPTRLCVVTDETGEQVHFNIAGRSNPDMDGSWAVTYLAPGVVRIVTGEDRPDVVFGDADIAQEILRTWRIDPRRLVREVDDNPGWLVDEGESGWRTLRYPGEDTDTGVRIVDGRLVTVQAQVDLPLRGRVPVHWNWSWTNGAAGNPEVEWVVDGETMFRASGSWRTLGAEETAGLWSPADDHPPRRVPGSEWPARIDMGLETLADGVHRVTGVRTGFSHLVVETGQGLVVADAPAGWVELHQLPPADLVPGLGVSGLSERFIDYLGEQFPGRPLRAVALTHAHDDHAGGARAFAAEGAAVYAPAGDADFLEQAFNRADMPPDRLSSRGGRVDVLPVDQRLELADEIRPVDLLPFGRNPHVDSALGVWVPDAGVFFQSDIHVPYSESAEPRTDRLATECWFADWAVRNLPESARVINSHSSVVTPVSRLADYLSNPACAGNG